MRLRALFIAGSLPVIGLVLPEIWRDAFDELRVQPYWPWVQYGFLAWLGAVGVVAWWAWFSKSRGEKIALSFLPGESPYEEIQQGQNLFMMAAGPGTAATPVRQDWAQKVCRVRVENLIDETLEDVALHLDQFDPAVSTLNDMPLHQMHDNPKHEADFKRIEWLNVSGGADAGPDWNATHREIIRSGYAYVGVSAQKVGVEGGPSKRGADDE